MALWSIGKAKQSGPSQEQAQARRKTFEDEIRLHDDLMYGAALFFEASSLLHENDPIVETYRKQFRNIIQSGRDATQRATALLEQARKDPRQISVLAQFDFAPFKGHPNPAEMLKRAKAFVDTYNRIFPGRPRDQEFTREDTFRLMEEAARAFDAAQSGQAGK